MRQLKRFYQFVWQQGGFFLAHVILMGISTLAFYAKPIFLSGIVAAAETGFYSKAIWLVFALGGSMLLATLLELVGYYLVDKVSAITSAKVMASVMQRIHELDFAYHASKSSGKLISLFNRGDAAFFDFYFGLNVDLVNFILGFLLMFFTMGNLNPRYALLTGLFFACTIICGYFILKKNLRDRTIFNQADDEVSAIKVDNLVNFDTVKYFAGEKYEQRRLRRALDKWVSTLRTHYLTFRLFDAMIYFFLYLFLIALGISAVADLRQGLITLGDFVLVFTFILTVFPNVMYVMYIIRSLARRNEDLERYLGVLNEPISVPDPKLPAKITHAPGTIVFDHVSFAYHQKQKVLQDFNLTIQPGEAVALVGFSGAGKTTIAKLLMRMYDVSAGKITIDGVNIKDLSKAYLRTRVGLVPQEPVMFNNTVYYNIAYSKPRASKKDVLTASKQAQIASFITKLGDGYQTKVGERGIKLSGGQRQRLAIARVLLQGAQIVIFDEATSSLDSQAEKKVQDSFWRMAKNSKRCVTSIIIAHRLSTIMRADRIVVLDRGRLVEAGTHDQLLHQPRSIYAKLWRLQQNGFLGDGESVVSEN